MLTRSQVFLAVITLSLFGASWFYFLQDPHDKSTQESSSAMLPAENPLYAQVLKPRPFIFPQDHGPHPQHRVEWWYFTGNVQTESKRRFGYELTFFRFALTPKALTSPSSWRTNQQYMAHFALTDVENAQFYTDERFSRAGNGLAGAKTNNYHVWLYDWRAKAAQHPDSSINLSASSDEFAIELQLTPEKNIALQGIAGFSQKSEKPGFASHYYSYTRMATRGAINLKGQQFSVSGSSWMDREWISASLSSEQIGWDWFSLQLSDGTDVMLYRFRRKDGAQDRHNSGAIFKPDNSKITLNFSELEIEEADYWSSPHTNIRYPAKWQISVPSQQLELEITPLINDQELNFRYRYWEGAVSIEGKKDEQNISGVGYVELTGYR